MKILLISLILWPIIAFAECGEKDSCDYINQWSDYSKFVVNYATSQKGKNSKFEYTENNSSLLITVTADDFVSYYYEIFGIARLHKGIGKTGIKNGHECYEDVSDTYSILQSYAIKPLYFLGRAVQGGPESLLGTKQVDVREMHKDTRVQINPGDHFTIKAPWTLTGAIVQGEMIRFNLSEKYKKDGEDKELFLDGSWSQTPTKLAINKNESLDNWLVCVAEKYSYIDGKTKYTPAIKDTSDLKVINDLVELQKDILI